MFKAIITKEWGEVGFGSSKRDGWAWTVTFCKDGKTIDEHYYKTAKVAKAAAVLFEYGLYHIGEYGGVKFEKLGAA